MCAVLYDHGVDTRPKSKTYDGVVVESIDEMSHDHILMLNFKNVDCFLERYGKQYYVFGGREYGCHGFNIADIKDNLFGCGWILIDNYYINIDNVVSIDSSYLDAYSDSIIIIFSNNFKLRVAGKLPCFKNYKVLKDSIEEV